MRGAGELSLAAGVFSGFFVIKFRTAQSKGFSLGELIVVIIVLGILSSLALAHFFEARARHGVTTQADQFRRNLSHTQLLAISQGLRLRMDVNSAGYQVVSCVNADCSATSPLTDPATGLNFNVALDGATLDPAGVLFFDTLGRPQDGAGLITLARTYTLSGSDRSVTVSVLPITGFAVTTY